MPEAVYRTMSLLCTLVAACPIGTNLGLLHRLWMLASGRLLAARIREKASVTGHLPLGAWGQRRRAAEPRTRASLAEAA